MDDQPGVTRDRHYGIAEWNGKQFTVIDTGGYVSGTEDVYEEAIRKQVEIAIQEANVLLFMVDIQQGLTGLDQDFAQVLRQTNKPVFVVVNKADTGQLQQATGEFYAMGLPEIYGISAMTGSGTGELLDAVTDNFEAERTTEEENGIPRIAVIGRPNVGKSSFVNALLGNERSIVTDRAGTTRDAIDSKYNLFGKEFIITDTAGVRKKARVTENIEFYSVMRAIKSLQDSDVCIILIDAETGLEAQDMHLIALGHKYHKGMILMVNKWDLIEKDSKSTANIEAQLKRKLGEMDYIPVIFASVLKKQRIFKVIEQAMEVYHNKFKKVPTSRLNETLLEIIKKNPPPAVRGKYIRIKYVTQLKAKWPAFAFFCNHPKLVREAYKRYLQNQLRSNFGFDGVPVGVFFRKK